MSQEPTLFGRSVKKNIMYGLEGTDREPSDEDIELAARLANASSFIEVGHCIVISSFILIECGMVFLVFSFQELTRDFLRWSS